MKTLSRILCVLLVACMSVSLFACGPTNPNNPSDSTDPANTKDPSETTDPGEDIDPYTVASKEIYNAQLGEFYDAYMKAKQETNLSKKFALMAIAEAKLLESGLMLPTSTKGGNYAISRVAPYTVDYTLWGNDSDRFHQAVVCNEIITSEDRTEMKAKWAELKGTGTYEAWAKDFLTSKGYTIKDSYTLGYNSNPETWDALATSLAADSEAIVNTFDGLYEYDVEGTLQPALAESYTVSDDGLTYTFKLRSGMVWVDSQGRTVANLVADDFVAAMQHMLEAGGGLEYLVEGVIVNASEYLNGEITDFAQVGVKALDDTTVQYSLVAPCSYFMTMLGYNIFAPMSRAYFLSQGGAFGADYNPEAETYLYGKTPDSIAYCGPYLVTNCTADSTIVFKANESYWNKDNINVKNLTWLFNNGDDQTKAYNDMLAGTIDGCGLNASSLELAKADGNLEKYGYVSSTDATSYMAFMNINRAAFVNQNDGTSVPTAQTEDDRVRTNAAMNNAHFRRALCFAVDRGAYNAQSVGEELKLFSVRNSYTPGTFVSLEEETTVSINGTNKTYPAGTFYGEIMQDQINADGIAIKAWDPAADDGVGSSDGFDGWFNVDAAKAELASAVAELAAKGVTVDADHPIYLDLPYPSNSATYTNKANALKQSIDAAFGGSVIVSLTECVDYKAWYYTGYYTDYGYEANYDIYDLSGWGPDYGDPATYLDTFLPDYSGYMAKCLGIF